MKIHAVSLQVRLAFIQIRRYLTSAFSIAIWLYPSVPILWGACILFMVLFLRLHDFRKPDLVPCSDMAGEVVAVGARVKNWKQGDRVSSNFSTDHLDGDTDEEIIKTSLGGQSQGVLTQYKNFPAHVRLPLSVQY